MAMAAALVSVCIAVSFAAPPAAEPPVETRPPNKTDAVPAFPGQTRAPMQAAGVAFRVTTLATGLEYPFGLVFLPDGRMLVTEKPGRLRIVAENGTLSNPVSGLPPIATPRYGGLLDVVLDPRYRTNRLIYLSFTEPRDGGAAAAVMRGRLDDKTAALSDVKVILRTPSITPLSDVVGSNGSRMIFGRDGSLYVSIGDRDQAHDGKTSQLLDNDQEKLLRITTDGAPAPGNPFVGMPGARPEIYAYGMRNILGMALHPRSGRLWTVENGPLGGDEINVPEAGRNYGWPVIVYGLNYDRRPMGDGITQKSGMEQPVYYWDPVIAPSGMAFYDAALFPRWKDSLFVGSLAQRHLVRLTVQRDRIVGEERLLVDLKKRIRDVRVGPEGAIYLLTDDRNGEVLKLTPG